MEKKKKKTWGKLLLLTALLLGTAFGVLKVQSHQVEAAVKNGWVQSGKTWYYYQNNKKLTNQWVYDKGIWYFMKPKTGAMETNAWRKWKGHNYYLKDSGAMAVGWLELPSGKYRFTRNGIRYRKGWHTIEGSRYYMNSNGTVKTGWFQDSNGKKYYLKMTGAKKGAAAVGTYIMSGYRRTFNSKGELIRTEKIDDSDKKNQLQKPTGTRTIRNYLLEALRPVGHTDYLLGGGWQPPDNTSKTVPSLMDCSGYVGWTTYQIMQKKAGVGSGYVVKSYDTTTNYQDRGWGRRLSHDALAKNNYKGSFKAGDIVNRRMGNEGHVWIVIGQCTDGSYVLVHSSPPCAQIAGTPSIDNRADSEAILLAHEYMNKYYGGVVQKHNIPGINTWATDLYSYITYSGVNSFRWSGDTLSDPDGFLKKDARTILKSLFGE